MYKKRVTAPFSDGLASSVGDIVILLATTGYYGVDPRTFGGTNPLRYTVSTRRAIYHVPTCDRKIRKTLTLTEVGARFLFLTPG